MKFEYFYRAREVITVGHDKRVYTERIDAGWILTVLTCYLHMPNSKSGDIAEVFVSNGGLELEIRSRARDLGKQGMSTLNPFYVGEHQRVIGHSPNSVLKDEICLTVIGYEMTLNDFRRSL